MSTCCVPVIVGARWVCKGREAGMHTGGCPKEELFCLEETFAPDFK